MRAGDRHPKVDAFLEASPAWHAETARLRQLLLAAGLEEGWKWAKPCYMLRGKNIAVIIGLKESVALSFLKGGLLADEERILSRPGEHSEVARWIKFTSVKQIAKVEQVLTGYLQEAMAAEQAGMKVKKTPAAERPVPEELAVALRRSAALRKAFAGLTPGRQRAYAIAVSRGKRAETREAYVAKYTPLILAGKGLGEDERAAWKAAKAQKKS